LECTTKGRSGYKDPSCRCRVNSLVCNLWPSEVVQPTINRDQTKRCEKRVFLQGGAGRGPETESPPWRGYWGSWEGTTEGGRREKGDKLKWRRLRKHDRPAIELLSLSLAHPDRRGLDSRSTGDWTDQKAVQVDHPFPCYESLRR